jgi:hypothetical protein
MIIWGLDGLSCRRTLRACGLRWYAGTLVRLYVNALGEIVDPAPFDNGILIWGFKEMWDVEAARVAHIVLRISRVGTAAICYKFWMPTSFHVLYISL